MSTTFTIPIRTISEANARGHWAKNLKLHDAQKFLARTLTKNALDELPVDHELRQRNTPINILMVRLAPRKLDDDNCVSSMKCIRDSIADVLVPGKRPGMADGGGRLAWTYNQRKAKKYGVEVTLSVYTLVVPPPNPF